MRRFYDRLDGFDHRLVLRNVARGVEAGDGKLLFTELAYRCGCVVLVEGATAVGEIIKVVDVISVNKLTEEENIKLLNSLKKYYNGYEVILNNKIDPTVVGGYHILVNGISMDLSIKRKIVDLQNHILN